MTIAAGLYAALVPFGFAVAAMWIAARLLPRARTLDLGARVLAGVFLAGVAAAWTGRFAEAGHLPLFGTYESALSLALATMIAATLWDRFGRGGPVAPLACLVSAALLAHGAAFDTTPYALTISERSWVVDVHAVLAWAAFGALAVATILALVIVVRPGDGDGRAAALTGALSIGFFGLSGMLVSGSVYKFLLFGRAWSFDPIEVLGFATWLCYGTLLHLRLMARWDARRLAVWSLAAFALLVVSYRVIVYFPPWSTYHIFDMDRRVHVVGGEDR